MIWTGHMYWLATIAIKLHAGLFIGQFLALFFVAGLCLGISGLVLGLVRLAKRISVGLPALAAPSNMGPSGAAASVHSATRPETRLKARLIILATLFCLLIMALVLNRPCSYTVGEACQIRVTDQNHQPVPGLRVVKSWGFSMEHCGNQERWTDSGGTVSFAPVSVEISLLKHLEMRWAPAAVHSWYPGRDSLPVTVYLPENLAARFDSELWRPAIPGDPTAYTNQSGIFVRYLRAYALANQNPNLAARTGLKIPRPNNTVGVGFPDGIESVELQVGENGEKL